MTIKKSVKEKTDKNILTNKAKDEIMNVIDESLNRECSISYEHNRLLPDSTEIESIKLTVVGERLSNCKKYFDQVFNERVKES
jgi:hypothetical protein